MPAGNKKGGASLWAELTRGRGGGGRRSAGRFDCVSVRRIPRAMASRVICVGDSLSDVRGISSHLIGGSRGTEADDTSVGGGEERGEMWREHHRSDRERERGEMMRREHGRAT